ncbi:MAG: exopolyphosphatase [Negativicutes bacterium]|nr:exopolyphosphatase [Negativicutes bacterium]
MERIGIIDLGSNSARLIVMNIYYNGAYNLVYHQKEAIRLGEGMGDSAYLQPASVERAVATLKVFAHMCQIVKADKIYAVATAAVRNAVNGADFLEVATKATNIPIKIISGETEARLGYLGIANTIDVSDAILFDLGGGSVELTLMRNRKIDRSVSLPLGSVNLSEKFKTQDKVSEAQLMSLRSFLMRQLAEVPWLDGAGLPLIGVGGTARNIAKMDQRQKNYPFAKVHNYRMSPMALENLWRALIKTNHSQRKKFPGLSSERADTIIAGITLVKTLFDITEGTNLIISGCGLREGLFMQHYLTRENKPLVLPDILEHSTRNMLLFYKGNIEHAEHVAELAAGLFDDLADIHNLGPRDKTLLNVAAMLHDIGITINYYDHARHSAYLVENARLFGLTHREQIFAAVIAGWHNGPSAKYARNKIYSEFLGEADWLAARKLALLLALAESLDSTQMQIVKQAKATVRDGKLILCLYTAGNAAIEIQDALQYKKWCRKELGLELTVQEVKMAKEGLNAR